jgi:hypothetical protein
VGRLALWGMTDVRETLALRIGLQPHRAGTCFGMAS